MVPSPRSRRQSYRDVRTRVYVEGPQGDVAEKASGTGTHGEREVWVQVGDAADQATLDAYADALLSLHSTPKESLDVGVAGDQHQAYVDYGVGDMVAAEDRDGMRTARADAITMRLGDQVDTDVTLVSRSSLRVQELENLLENMSDARRAANPDLQRRHGLISVDRLLSGSIQVDTDITSSNFTSGSDGYRIRGDGSAEFNTVTIRGTAESSNYDPGVTGWQIHDDGSAEFNDIVIRDTLESDNYSAGSAGWQIHENGSAELNDVVIRGDIKNPSVEILDNVTNFYDPNGSKKGQLEASLADAFFVRNVDGGYIRIQSTDLVIYSPDGNQKLQVDNEGISVLGVVHDDLEFSADGFGPILISGDGSKWRIDVDNSGNLSTTSV